jgi:hypothetical protein
MGPWARVTCGMHVTRGRPVGAPKGIRLGCVEYPLHCPPFCWDRPRSIYLKDKRDT